MAEDDKAAAAAAGPGAHRTRWTLPLVRRVVVDDSTLGATAVLDLRVWTRRTRRPQLCVGCICVGNCRTFAGRRARGSIVSQQQQTSQQQQQHQQLLHRWRSGLHQLVPIVAEESVCYDDDDDDFYDSTVWNVDSF